MDTSQNVHNKWQKEKLVNNVSGNIIPELRRHFRQICVKEQDNIFLLYLRGSNFRF